MISLIKGDDLIFFNKKNELRDEFWTQRHEFAARAARQVVVDHVESLIMPINR